MKDSKFRMSIKDALDVLRPQEETLEGIRAAFKKMSFEWHPDHNPGKLNAHEVMCAINEAYEVLVDAFNEGKLKCSWKAEAGAKSVFIPEMEVALNKLRNCKGLEIELCGIFLWIGGNTKYWYKYLKVQEDNGRKLFQWSPNKEKWYWHPSYYKRASKTPWSMDRIRGCWGSKQILSDDSDRAYLS